MSGKISNIADPPARNVERRPVADPNVTIGPYRILQRTCGDFVLYDDRLPDVSKRTAGGASSVAEATQLAKKLVAAGAPVRYVEVPVPGAHNPRGRR